MSTPFEELGLRAWADPDEIRSAYRALVKKCHPDMVQDPALKEEAQQRMIRLNKAYEEALRLATPRKGAAYVQKIPLTEALTLAEKMLARDNPESALRQLMRADRKNDAWHYTHGRALMAMERYHEAHLAFREAVKLSPDNNTYRAGALEAALKEKKARTPMGRARQWVRNLTKKK